MVKKLDDSMMIWYADNFLDTTPRTQSIKEIIHKLEFIVIKMLCSVNKTIVIKRQQQEIL